MLRVDLHLHSRYSHDSRTSLEALVERCAEIPLDRIALTDHNTADGALRLKELAPELAIVGEEVKTTEGEVVCLFISASIRPFQRPETVMDLVHEMGGLVYLAHPFDRFRASFAPHRVVDLADRIDIIEVHNAWARPEDNRAAARICDELGLVAATGSDAHATEELGRSWMEMEDYSDSHDFLEKLRAARHVVTPLSGTGRPGMIAARGLVAVGSIALDTLVGDFGQVDDELGGSALYFALAARLAAPSLPIAIVAPVGEDMAGPVRALAEAHEIDTTYLQVVGAPTFRWSARGFGGRNVDVATRDSIYDHWKPSVPEGLGDWGFVGSMRPDHQVSAARALAGRQLIAGDAMLSYVLRSPREAFELPDLCTWFFANEDELAALRGDAAAPGDYRTAHSLEGVLVKRGPAGVRCSTAATQFDVPAAPTTVVDTTGAGDSVAGGMLARWLLAGKSDDALLDAVRWGVAAAAITVSDIGLRGLLRAGPPELEFGVRELTQT